MHIGVGIDLRRQIAFQRTTQTAAGGGSICATLLLLQVSFYSSTRCVQKTARKLNLWQIGEHYQKG